MASLRSHWGMMLRTMAVAAALAGCTGMGGPTGPIQPELPTIVDPPARPDVPTILIAAPGIADFQAVRERLVSEVQSDYNISTLVVSSQTSVKDLAAALEKTAPKCIVLMNNTTVNLYREYQRAQREGRPFPAALIVMTSFLEELQPTLVNATGVAYEVPGVTAFMDLRAIMKRPLRRIGVVFRPMFANLVTRQKTLATREHFDLIPAAIPKQATTADVKRALKSLLQDSKVDALWMLNDNELINSADFLQTWRTESTEANVPLIVGVPTLVDARTPLGSFAVVPDLDGLGLQAANLVFELADDDWNAADHRVQLPHSVRTIADAKQMRERFGISDDLAHLVDRVVE